MRTPEGRAVGKATTEVVTERARLQGRRLMWGRRLAAQTDKQPVPLEPASETTDVTAKGIDSTPTEPALYFPHVLVEFA